MLHSALRQKSRTEASSQRTQMRTTSTTTQGWSLKTQPHNWAEGTSSTTPLFKTIPSNSYEVGGNMEGPTAGREGVLPGFGLGESTEGSQPGELGPVYGTESGFDTMAEQTSNGEFDAPLQETSSLHLPRKPLWQKETRGIGGRHCLPPRSRDSSWGAGTKVGSHRRLLLALPPPVLFAQSPEPHKGKCLQKKEDRGRRDLPVRRITLKIWQRQTEETQ